MKMILLVLSGQLEEIARDVFQIEARITVIDEIPDKNGAGVNEVII